MKDFGAVNGDELASLLANRFQEIVPPGFHVQDDGGMLWFSMDAGLGFWGGRAGSYVRNTFELDAESLSFEQRVLRASEIALNDLQDYVDEESTEPWPEKRTVPSIHAEIRDGELHLWFGERGVELLKCNPIGLR